jgi:hypothetical protein
MPKSTLLIHNLAYLHLQLQHLACQATRTSTWTLQTLRHLCGMHHARKLCLALLTPAVTTLHMCRQATQQFLTRRCCTRMSTRTSLAIQQVATCMQTRSASGQHRASILSYTLRHQLRQIDS